MWFNVDDSLLDHPKVRQLGKATLNALGLWVACGSWAARNKTDGFVPRSVLTQFPNSSRSAQHLIRVGMWSEATQHGLSGYQFHDWDQWQPTRAHLESIRRSRAEAGRRGGQRSGEVRRNKSEANASEANEAKRTPTPTPTPLATDVASPPTPPARSAPRERDRFREFYDAYPRHVAPKAAEKAWAGALRDGADPDHVIAAARRYAAECRGREARYIAHPATWLNQGRYDDRPAVEHRPRTRAEEWQQLKNGHQPVLDAEIVNEPRRALP